MRRAEIYNPKTGKSYSVNRSLTIGTNEQSQLKIDFSERFPFHLEITYDSASKSYQVRNLNLRYEIRLKRAKQISTEVILVESAPLKMQDGDVLDCNKGNSLVFQRNLIDSALEKVLS